MCELIKRPETKVAGLRVQCDTLEEFSIEIPKVFDKLDECLDGIPNIVDSSGRIGIHLAEDENNANAEAADYGYLVCVEVSSFEDIPTDFETDTIPAGKFAVNSHQGPVNPNIHHSYAALYNWMSEHGHEELPVGHVLEHYDERYDRKNFSGEMEILIPVKS
ncbi:MAG TPA: GyrI-like domain-containing protein [Bacillales bacterium]|nr:GyrI-like domain-containing protein [Bacillales bacterium]